jgi:hypothetical protein
MAPVAQRVVLYDEDPSDPKGKQYVGSVIWRTEPIKASGNQKPDVAVRADIEIPDRKFKMTMSFRRNTDTSLPASHTAELTFHPAAGFLRRRRRQRAGHLMKSNEQARGTPLAGSPSRSPTASSWSASPTSIPTAPANLQLLKERSWFDVPAGLRQPAPRHHRDRKGLPRRTRVQRRVRDLGGVVSESAADALSSLS